MGALLERFPDQKLATNPGSDGLGPRPNGPPGKGGSLAAGASLYESYHPRAEAS